MSGIVYSDDDERYGLVLSHHAAATAHLALEDREAELMERIDRYGPSEEKARLLSSTRVALVQLGRTPAQAWQARCRYIDWQAS